MKKLGIYLAIVATICFGFFFYSMHILRFSITINETFLSSHKIPRSFDGTRIIHFSDLLIGSTDDLRLLERAVHEINEINPDVIAFTGNLFEEGAITNTLSSQATDLLSQLDSTIGKVAVLGYADMSQARMVTDVLESASFNVLRNDSLELFNGTINGVTFIGVDSLATNPNLENLLSKLSTEDSFNVLLLSEPMFASIATSYPVALQLSGYCRGLNAIWDETHLDSCQQFSNGIYRFADQLLLNVNTGVNRPNHPSTLLRRPTIDSFLLMRQQ